MVYLSFLTLAANTKLQNTTNLMWTGSSTSILTTFRKTWSRHRFTRILLDHEGNKKPFNSIIAVILVFTPLFYLLWMPASMSKYIAPSYCSELFPSPVLSAQEGCLKVSQLSVYPSICCSLPLPSEVQMKCQLTLWRHSWVDWHN